MGSSNTKVDHPKNEGIVENTQGGFHVFEVHAPSMGVGIGAFVLLVCLCCILYVMYRRMKKRIERRCEQRPWRASRFPIPPSMDLRHPQLWGPPPMPFPAVSYRAYPREARITEINEAPDDDSGTSVGPSQQSRVNKGREKLATNL